MKIKIKDLKRNTIDSLRVLGNNIKFIELNDSKYLINLLKIIKKTLNEIIHVQELQKKIFDNYAYTNKNGTPKLDQNQEVIFKSKKDKEIAKKKLKEMIEYEIEIDFIPVTYKYLEDNDIKLNINVLESLDGVFLVGENNDKEENKK